MNNRTNGVEFHPDKDEYICLYFRDRDGLTLADLRVEIDGLGAPAIILSKIGVAPNGLIEWQANLRVPPGLAEGPHEVRMRTVTSPYSNGFEIVMGVVPHRARPAVSGVADPPSIIAVENSFDRTNVFRGYKTESLSCRFRSSEADLAGDAVTLEIDGADHPIRLLTDLSGGEWQISARLSRDAAAGAHSVRVKTERSGFSEPAAFVYDPA